MENLMRTGKAFASLLLLLALPAVAAAATPIAGGRDLPLGTTVTIEGRGTVPSGLFSSASLEDQGFALRALTLGPSPGRILGSPGEGGDARRFTPGRFARPYWYVTTSCGRLAAVVLSPE
jgi:hypothetical protein